MRINADVVKVSGAALCAAMVLGFTPAASAWDYGFHSLSGEASGMSYDGSVVVVGNTDLYSTAGLRTATLSSPASDSYTLYRVYGLNDDGSAFVGNGAMNGAAGWGFGLYQREGGPFHSWGQSLQSYQTQAKGVSGDGNRVLIETGYLFYPSAEIVNADGSPLPPTPRGILDQAGWTTATAISRDGNAYIGSAALELGDVAYRFRVGEGVDALESPPEYADRPSVARDLSDDGSVVVGRVYTGNSTSLMCIWNGLDATAVLSPSGYENALATAVAGDGVTVGATLWYGAGSNLVRDAYIWTQASGYVSAGSFFAMHGVSVPFAESIAEITQISSDGRTFLCQYEDEQSFLVVIPAPSSLALLGVATLACRRRR